jgi:hypothetical protein
MWTPDLFAADASSLDSHANAPLRGIFTVSRYGYFIGQTVLGSEFDRRELSALNLGLSEEDHDTTVLKLASNASG